MAALSVSWALVEFSPCICSGSRRVIFSPTPDSGGAAMHPQIPEEDFFLLRESSAYFSASFAKQRSIDN
jgi:hypothetical protein